MVSPISDNDLIMNDFVLDAKNSEKFSVPKIFSAIFFLIKTQTDSFFYGFIWYISFLELSKNNQFFFLKAYTHNYLSAHQKSCCENIGRQFHQGFLIFPTVFLILLFLCLFLQATCLFLQAICLFLQLLFYLLL